MWKRGSFSKLLIGSEVDCEFSLEVDFSSALESLRRSCSPPTGMEGVRLARSQCQWVNLNGHMPRTE